VRPSLGNVMMNVLMHHLMHALTALMHCLIRLMHALMRHQTGSASTGCTCFRTCKRRFRSMSVLRSP
jgi:hypothetical protein